MEENGVLEELENVLGAEGADHFVDYYAGSNLYVPKNIIATRKHRKIREEFKNGAGYRELARRYGYTEQHIRRIVHKKK